MRWVKLSLVDLVWEKRDEWELDKNSLSWSRVTPRNSEFTLNGVVTPQNQIFPFHGVGSITLLVWGGSHTATDQQYQSCVKVGLGRPKFAWGSKMPLQFTLLGSQHHCYTRAPSPEYQNLPRAACPEYQIVPRAASPEYQNVPRAACPEYQNVHRAARPKSKKRT